MENEKSIVWDDKFYEILFAVLVGFKLRTLDLKIGYLKEEL